MTVQNLLYQRDIEQLKERYKLRFESLTILSKTFKLLMPKSMDDLLDEYEDEFEADEKLPYWANIWESALIMAEIILEQYEFSNQTVLELGSGLGLAGLAARAKGASVIYSDYDANCFPFIKINHRMNFNENATVIELDWRKIQTDKKFDWIIAADIVYEPKMYPVIIRAIDQLLSTTGKMLLTEPSRKFAVPFFDGLHKKGFKTRQQSRLIKNSRDIPVTINFYEITRQKGDS